jgi:sugar phosphate isomerase/epimerase
MQMATLGAAASIVGGPQLRSPAAEPAGGDACKVKFKLGLASYTLRKFDLDQTLAMTARVGLTHIALKDFHLPMDSTPQQIEEVVKKVQDAGLELYGGGVIYMRDAEQVRHAFAYAKAAGMSVIIGVAPYELLPLVEEMVKQYDIQVAIHNHGPGDKLYPLPETAYEKIKDLDKRIGLCNDIGHTMRAGVDPAVSAENLADRLLDVHIKDVSAPEAKGRTVEVGRGVIDIPNFLRTLIRIDYAGIVAFEYEKDPDDPLAGLAESVGYVRGVLASIG